MYMLKSDAATLPLFFDKSQSEARVEPLHIMAPTSSCCLADQPDVGSRST